MSQPHSSDEANTKTIADAYVALNAGDVDGFVRAFDPQVVRIEWAGTPAAGTWRGIDAVRAHVVAGRGTWAEGGCEPTRFVVGRGEWGDRVVAIVHVRVRVKGRTDWAEGDVGDVYTFRDGRVVEFQSFMKSADALAYAGVA